MPEKAPTSLVIVGATILDGVSDRPLHGQAILVTQGRIQAIGTRNELAVSDSVVVLDATGKYVIPGLIDANVHLLIDTRLENLVRYEDRYEALIAEAAQVALKNGVTTVFDTWGPRQALLAVREQINAGEIPGSRIFCAGNIVGLNGPLSEDFYPKSLAVASGTLVERINSLWAENVGPELMWMTPEQVAREVRLYAGKGIDFIKYASSDHRGWGPAFLVFSSEAQSGIVREAHAAGMTAQAHAMSVESLRVALEAGADIIQHCDITGPTPIPQNTLQLLVESKVGATVFPMTERRYRHIVEQCGASSPLGRTLSTWERNDRNLIESGATLLLATDAGITAADALTDPALKNLEWWVGGEDRLARLGEGHFHWLQAMEEKGLAPLEMLKAATRNIAAAYKKDADLGTLQPGKIADLLILDKDPLQSAANYRSIHAVIKDGIVVNTGALPAEPILTKPRADTAVYATYPEDLGRFPQCC
jgi:imidazolonepropionase-like amidohydrolase